jgi:hypothetical protein
MAICLSSGLKFLIQAARHNVTQKLPAIRPLRSANPLDNTSVTLVASPRPIRWTLSAASWDSKQHLISYVASAGISIVQSQENLEIQTHPLHCAEIPYTRKDLAWGFDCPELFRATVHSFPNQHLKRNNHLSRPQRHARTRDSRPEFRINLHFKRTVNRTGIRAVAGKVAILLGEIKPSAGMGKRTFSSEALGRRRPINRYRTETQL